MLYSEGFKPFGQLALPAYGCVCAYPCLRPCLPKPAPVLIHACA